MREDRLHIATKRSLLIIAMLFLISSANATITNALKLKISNATYSDETVIRYLAGATSDFDASYDSWKLFSSNPSVPAIYTMIDPVSSLGINALPELLTDQQTKVYARVGSTGDYTITAIELGAFASNIDIIIENTVTGEFQNLRTNPVYSFTVADTGVFNSNPGKFKVYFSLPVIFSVTDATRTNGNGACVIAKQGIDSWTYTVTNSSNVVIASTTINNDTDTLINLLPGTYSFLSYFGNTTTQLQTFVISDVVSGFSINPDTLIGLNATVGFFNLSQNTTNYKWDFGDQSPASTTLSPSHKYTLPGNFKVKLIAQNGASVDSTIKIIHVTVATQISNSAKEDCKLFFTDNVLTVDFNNGAQQNSVLTVFTIDGQEVISRKLADGSKITVPMNEQARGIYLVKLQTDTEYFTKKILVN